MTFGTGVTNSDQGRCLELGLGHRGDWKGMGAGSGGSGPSSGRTPASRRPPMIQDLTVCCVSSAQALGQRDVLASGSPWSPKWPCDQVPRPANLSFDVSESLGACGCRINSHQHEGINATTRSPLGDRHLACGQVTAARPPRSPQQVGQFNRWPRAAQVDPQSRRRHLGVPH